MYTSNEGAAVAHVYNDHFLPKQYNSEIRQTFPICALQNIQSRSNQSYRISSHRKRAWKKSVGLVCFRWKSLPIFENFFRSCSFKFTDWSGISNWINEKRSYLEASLNEGTLAWVIWIMQKWRSKNRIGSKIATKGKVIKWSNTQWSTQLSELICSSSADHRFFAHFFAAPLSRRP